MKKTILHLYCAAVCLLSVAAIVVLLGTLINVIIDRVSYEKSMQPWELRRYEDNDSFYAWASSERNGLELRLSPGSPRPDETTLTALRKSSEAQYHAFRKAGLERAIREQLIYALLATVAFFAHFWLLQRQPRRESPGDA